MTITSKAPLAPAIYVRISQDRDGNAVGVTDQISQCREHAEKLGWPEPVVYKDNDLSAAARNKKRPDFERLLVDIEEGRVDGLMCRHLDRLLRRVLDLERVLDAVEAPKRPVPVVLVQGGEIDLATASGRLLARILASVAANEVEMKSERVSQARFREAHAGRAHGALGYGYDAEQHIVPEEAAIVREVAQRILAGESFYAVATSLNGRGVPTPGAGRWDARRVARAAVKEASAVADLIAMARRESKVQAQVFARAMRNAGAQNHPTTGWVRDREWFQHLDASDHGLDDSTVARLLVEAGVPAERSYWRASNLRSMIRRGSLCGWREFSPGQRGGRGRMVAEGSWTPILSKETVEAIREITDRPGHRRRGRDPKYLLATVLKCGDCGSSLGGSIGNGSYRYTCSKQPGRTAASTGEPCGGLTVAGPQTDRIVGAAVIKALADAKVRSGHTRRRSAGSGIRAAEKELEEITELRRAYGTQAGQGRIHPDAFGVLMEELDARQRAAERVLGAWAPPVRAVLDDVPKEHAAIVEWWGEASMRRKREIILALIEKIEIRRSSRHARRFDPARIGEPVWRI